MNSLVFHSSLPRVFQSRGHPNLQPPRPEPLSYDPTSTTRSAALAAAPAGARCPVQLLRSVPGPKLPLGGDQCTEDRALCAAVPRPDGMARRPRGSRLANMSESSSDLGSLGSICWAVGKLRLESGCGWCRFVFPLSLFVRPLEIGVVLRCAEFKEPCARALSLSLSLRAVGQELTLGSRCSVDFQNVKFTPSESGAKT